MALGEDGFPHRFDHEDRNGGGSGADQRFRGHIGLRRDLAELAFGMGLRMGPGILMAVGGPLIAENAEQIDEESPQQEPAEAQGKMKEASHTRGGI